MSGVAVMAERALSYTNPLGGLSLLERLAHARSRVRSARLLLDIHPDDNCYAAALTARIAELDALEALRPPSKVPRKRGRDA